MVSCPSQMRALESCSGNDGGSARSSFSICRCLYRCRWISGESRSKDRRYRRYNQSTWRCFVKTAGYELSQSPPSSSARNRSGPKPTFGR